MFELAFTGTSVKYVLEQDKAAFIRLTGISVLQSAANSFVAPTLRYDFLGLPRFISLIKETAVPTS